MNRALRLSALVLPLVGFAALWGWTDYESRQGTEWDVEIRGYDPRDLLRGHYVQFSYDWNGLDDRLGMGDPPARLCLEGDPPGPPLVRRIEGEFGDCPYPAEADYGGVYGSNSLLLGRLYVGQERAGELDRALRDPDMRGVVRVRLGSNRRLVPIDITMRPLTQAEREDAASE
ncbi:hypothetical protein NAP1_14213 [Erythrobacter sp. NAP1]|uniref:GDYXXLXY domain-containing protein n=1 Tax=Erythrobacter sp. NAP1 TaxID=237727 RepID=UPI00006879C0|nr:GDYXXLXY domain-containing protein [Erythrobacter sp. NAP1]EAQ28760.1 hypothetical protein NAP1_14213 [Erythrobacter sp. NAP1]